ncbi:DUF2249 domain-containing protein, partial [Cobetia amphilecti]
QDLRHLAPPEPMEIILDAAEQMRPGDSRAWVLPHHPTPLLPMLEKAGLLYRFELSGDGGVVLILSAGSKSREQERDKAKTVEEAECTGGT